MKVAILLAYVLVVAGGLLALYLCDKKRARQHAVDNAKQLAESEARRAHQHKLAALEPGVRIECFGDVYEIISCAVLSAPLICPEFLYGLDDGVGGLAWLSVGETAEPYEYHVHLWRQIDFDGPLPSFEAWDDVIVEGRVYSPGSRFEKLYSPSRAAWLGAPPTNTIARWSYRPDCDGEEGCEASESRLHIEQLNGEWRAGLGRGLKPVEVTILDA